MVQIKVENLLFFICILAIMCMIGACSAANHEANIDSLETLQHSSSGDIDEAKTLPRSSSGDIDEAKVAILEDSSKYRIVSRKTLLHGVRIAKSLLAYPNLPGTDSVCKDLTCTPGTSEECPKECECWYINSVRPKRYLCYDVAATPVLEPTADDDEQD